MKIKVINPVLARRLHNDGSDAGFAQLTPGVYDSMRGQQKGFIRIFRPKAEDLFINLNKLEWNPD